MSQKDRLVPAPDRPAPSPHERDRACHRFIVRKIEEELGAQRLSWRQLAQMSGVPQSTLATQKRRRFSVEVLIRLARALGVSVGSLFPPTRSPVSGGPDGEAVE